MKKQLTVLAVLFGAILGLKAQEGSILYTDFEPDTCVTLEEGGDIFTLDLNQDGNPDVFFSAYWHSAVGNIANMHVGSNWEFCGSDGGYPLTDTTIINNSLHWSHYSTDLAMYPERTHFAFRHQTEDGYHYGWAKIYVESLARVCVSEMAYCTIPNYPLKWGQTTIPQGVEENPTENHFSVYPNPANDVLIVETFPETSPNGTITSFETFQETSLQTYRITNMMGQTILSGRIIAETHQINIESLSAGMYFITFAGETRKFVVR